MYKSVDKVVAEYVFTVLNLEFPIKGRICERMGTTQSMRFNWTVSHYYKFAKEAPGGSPPAKTECGSKEEAERLLFSYVRDFTAFAEPNKAY